MEPDESEEANSERERKRQQAIKEWTPADRHREMENAGRQQTREIVQRQQEASQELQRQQEANRDLQREMSRRRDEGRRRAESQMDEGRRRAESQAHQRRRDNQAEADEQQRREDRALQEAQEHQHGGMNAPQASRTQRTAAEVTHVTYNYDCHSTLSLRNIAQRLGLNREGGKAVVMQRLHEYDLEATRRRRAHLEAEEKEMENAQKVADDYDAREAQRVAAVYEANETGMEDMGRARQAQQVADDREAMEAAQRVADEADKQEEDKRRREIAITRLNTRAQGEGYVISEEQILVEISAVIVDEKGEEILRTARARMPIAADAEKARQMQEEEEHEKKKEEAQKQADLAMGRSITTVEANEIRRQRLERGDPTKCSSERLADHVEDESERRLGCEARGYEYVPIPFIEEVLEEDGTGRLQLQTTDGRKVTESYIQMMVSEATERKRRAQQGLKSEVPEGSCAICREPTPLADRIYCNSCGQFACRDCFMQWMRIKTTCMYCVQPWRKN